MSNIPQKKKKINMFKVNSLTPVNVSGPSVSCFNEWHCRPLRCPNLVFDNYSIIISISPQPSPFPLLKISEMHPSSPILSPNSSQHDLPWDYFYQPPRWSPWMHSLPSIYNQIWWSESDLECFRHSILFSGSSSNSTAACRTSKTLSLALSPDLTITSHNAKIC